MENKSEICTAKGRKTHLEEIATTKILLYKNQSKNIREYIRLLLLT